MKGNEEGGISWLVETVVLVECDVQKILARYSTNTPVS